MRGVANRHKQSCRLWTAKGRVNIRAGDERLTLWRWREHAGKAGDVGEFGAEARVLVAQFRQTGHRILAHRVHPLYGAPNSRKFSAPTYIHNVVYSNDQRPRTRVLLRVFLARDVIYTSRAYATMSVSVCQSVTEVHWRIIANLGFKFRSKFTAHCGRGER